MNWQQHIVADPKILYGNPVIKHTRVPVDLVLEKLAAGDTVEDLLNAYPSVTKDDIIACLLFAAEAVKKKYIQNPPELN